MGGMSDFGKGVGKFIVDTRDTVPNAIASAKKGDLGGVAEAGVRPLTNAWETGKDNMKKGKQGGTPADLPSSSTVPQVTAPPVAPQLATPTQGFAVPKATAAQIQFNPNQQYAQQAQGAQSGLIQQLAAQAQGQGPSLAEQQLRQSQEANMAAVMAQLSSSRGGANPLLQRQALTTSADIQAQTARDAATARLQEQMQAQSLLGQVSGQAVGQGLETRGQDIGLATSQAGLNQQAGLAGFNAQVDSNKTLFGAQQQTQLAQAELAAKYAAMGMDAQRANQAAFLDIERLRMQGALGNAGIAQQGQAANNQMMGGLASGAGTIIGAYFGGPSGAAMGNQAGGMVAGQNQNTGPATVNYAPAQANPQTGDYGPTPTAQSPAYYSDETLKTNISDGSGKLAEFLNALSASEYEYKDKKHGAGKFVSPMAQELQKSEIGKSMVSQGEDGLKVDYGRAAGTFLSAAAMLHDRLKKLEKKRGH